MYHVRVLCPAVPSHIILRCCTVGVPQWFVHFNKICCLQLRAFICDARCPQRLCAIILTLLLCFHVRGASLACGTSCLGWQYCTACGVYVIGIRQCYITRDGRRARHSVHVNLGVSLGVYLGMDVDWAVCCRMAAICWGRLRAALFYLPIAQVGCYTAELFVIPCSEPVGLSSLFL